MVLVIGQQEIFYALQYCLVHHLHHLHILNMPLRPIIEGETNWDNIDGGSEPADIEFLEQIANEGGGNHSRDNGSKLPIGIHP